MSNSALSVDVSQGGGNVVLCSIGDKVSEESLKLVTLAPSSVSLISTRTIRDTVKDIVRIGGESTMNTRCPETA
jgi:hypothetical protein